MAASPNPRVNQVYYEQARAAVLIASRLPRLPGALWQRLRLGRIRTALDWRATCRE